MTKRLRRASDEATRSHALVEQQRERLAVILAGLSTGVLVVDTDLTLRTANAAANAILGAEVTGFTGKDLAHITEESPRLAEFARQVAARLQESDGNWQGEMALPPRPGAALCLRAAGRGGGGIRATSSCSTTSRTCCMPSAMRPGARSPAGLPTRSRTR